MVKMVHYLILSLYFKQVELFSLSGLFSTFLKNLFLRRKLNFRINKVYYVLFVLNNKNIWQNLGRKIQTTNLYIIYTDKRYKIKFNAYKKKIQGVAKNCKWM